MLSGFAASADYTILACGAQIIHYNELKARDYEVFTGKTYKGEIDFVAINGRKKCFIQVAYYLAGKETIEREFGAFRPISDASPEYSCAMKSHFRKSGNQMSGKWKSSFVSLLA